MFPRAILLLVLLATALRAQTPARWTLAANRHFEVYSQRGEESARAALAWFERLRGLLIREMGLQPDRLRPARVIGFGSAAEYQAYRIHSPAEAYYVGTEGRDYIVMKLDGPAALGTAAHEYAHMALHSTGLELPRWLAEGLAEVFATVRAEGADVLLGFERPEHSRALRQRSWIALGDLLRGREGANGPPLFYAETWGLTDMLAFSPEYGSKLRALVGALAAMPPEEAFASVYGRTLDRVTADLRAWVDRRKSTAPVRLPGVAADGGETRVEELAPMRARLLLAGLLLDAGELSRAEAAYAALQRDVRDNGDVAAGLGMIALQQGRRDEAHEQWGRAIRLGVSDDALCYRWAAMAQNAGMKDADIRPALQRAVAMRPDFDDARYSLALLEKNAGQAEAALEHLRAMRAPGPARAFAYWSAVSDALNSLDRHEEAEDAARTAAAHASNDAERARAAELAYIARTELAVRLTRDAEGRPRMATTRIPRRTVDWNPFVEPSDDVRTIEGALREVDCSGPGTRIVVEGGGGRVTLAISNPARVQMRNAPGEFTCGAQAGERVVVVYAAPRSEAGEGVVRGIEFRR